MEAIPGILIVWIIWAFIRWAARSTSGGSGGTGRSVAARQGGLALSAVRDAMPTPDGERLPFTLIRATGAFSVPRAEYPCVRVLRVWDVTESGADPMPVVSLDGDFRDENGWFLQTDGVSIPHQSVTIDGYFMGVVPDLVVLAPRQGKRRFRAHASFLDAADPSVVYAQGTVDFDFDETAVGYMEAAAHNAAIDRRIASLGLAVAASDGSVDRAEVEVIKEFFRQMFSGSDDSVERKQNVSAAMRENIDALKADAGRAAAIVVQQCTSLAGESVAVRRIAYELCVRVVAADGAIEGDEQTTLWSIAKRLALPEQLVKETDDRWLKVGMFSQGMDDLQRLGIPVHLAPEEICARLTDAYKTWRQRGAARDPEKAREANERLELIARLQATYCSD